MFRAKLPILAAGLVFFAASSSVSKTAEEASSPNVVTYDLQGGAHGTVVSRHPTLDSTAAPLEPGLSRWVSNSARAVEAYYGRFPTKTRVFVETGGTGKVRGGTTWGTKPATIRVWTGAAITPQDLREDWVLPHEMVHLALPSLPNRHSWLEEGVATYVEPIARAKAGLADPDEVWRWMLWGLPRGVASVGDRGLDEDHRWGRTYWGGALFCLLADVRIRESTGNRHSLGDALRGILLSGGNVGARWSLAETLEAGDRAVGVSVLRNLYREMGRAPGTVSLPRLFQDLGVKTSRAGVVYDDTAPLAAIRRSITVDLTEPDGFPRSQRLAGLLRPPSLDGQFAY